MIREYITYNKAKKLSSHLYYWNSNQLYKISSIKSIIFDHWINNSEEVNGNLRRTLRMAMCTYYTVIRANVNDFLVRQYVLARARYFVGMCIKYIFHSVTIVVSHGFVMTICDWDDIYFEWGALVSHQQQHVCIINKQCSCCISHRWQAMARMHLSYR